MRNKNKINLLTVFTAMIMLLTMMRMFTYPINAVTVEKVNLGTTSNFALLAGESITHTGAILINGDAGNDVGLHPGTAFDPTGVTMVGGTVYIADSVASQAKTDLITAYNDAESRTTTTTISADLGGMTLYPGVYTKADGLSIADGTTLTLDAQGDPNAVFIFQSGSTLITGVNSVIELVNGARYCRTFWQVGSSATLGAGSTFVGHIFASISITANTGAFIQGQLLASTGSIVLDTNTITNGECADVAVINVTKTPSVTSLPAGGGSVTYTYVVTNLTGMNLANIGISDDRISVINYISGDSNTDELLQPDETWTFAATTNLAVTTTNTVTVTALADDVEVSDTAVATVTVSATEAEEAAPPTTDGGTLPVTSTFLWKSVIIGSGLIMVGVLGILIRKYYNDIEIDEQEEE